ncbi:hypothetical protein E2562_036962 [Oryza meyeriana var. granulata]|uniref:Uncharacterized protein n=1 Tax=Oryza meyeriana var. granulata TaxID=110450 RepID=A0A6G1ETL5_9ORYZ|nr:hypothetical protein E2562_036962 [Oryza meyeriana var. granulata]
MHLDAACARQAASARRKQHAQRSSHEAAAAPVSPKAGVSVITIAKAAVEKSVEKEADAHQRVTGEIDDLPVNENEEGAGEKDRGHLRGDIAVARKRPITEVLQDPPPLPPRQRPYSTPQIPQS